MSIEGQCSLGSFIWCQGFNTLTHWGRVTHICVSKLTIIGSDNGLSPGPRQAIIWTNAGILLIGPSGTNFSEIEIEIHTFSFKEMHSKMSSGKWRPFCLGLNVLNPEQNGWHSADILMRILQGNRLYCDLNFTLICPRRLFNNKSSLVHVLF